LFEVDEAATRIREEVDQEANIILGATFDENLEGVIRVSVVATGIDNSVKLSEQPPAVRRTEAVTRSAPIAAPAAKVDAPAQPATAQAKPAEAQKASPTPSETTKEIEKTAASMALPEKKAPVQRDGVTLEPFKPSNLFSDPKVEEEFKSALEEELMPSAETFIPPAAEEPAGIIQPTVIPEVSDFPPMVQAEAAQRQAPQPATQPENQGPMGLLNKLKSSFTGRDEAPRVQAAAPQAATPPAAGPKPAAPSAPQAAPVREPVRQTAAPQQSAQPRMENDPYAPRKGQLDNMGRINPSEKPMQDDDQLDIPAFLRRQSN